MSFYNGWMRKNLEVTFDFENNKTSESSYQFYTGTDFTFVADLTNNDTTKVNGVTLFIYTSGNEVRPLEAKYDKKRDKWIATSKFESDNLPVNISAKIDACAAAILSVWEALSVGYSKHRIIFPSVYVKALHLNYIYIHIYIYS